MRDTRSSALERDAEIEIEIDESELEVIDPRDLEPVTRGVEEVEPEERTIPRARRAPLPPLPPARPMPPPRRVV